MNHYRHDHHEDHRRRRGYYLNNLRENAHELRMWIQNVFIPGAMILATIWANKRSSNEKGEE